MDTLTRNLYIRRNRCYVYGQYHGAFTDDPSHPFSITIERKIPMPDHYQWALSSCGFDTLVVQTYGWSIPHGTLSGNYPCGEIDMRYAARRELFFSVNPPDTIHDTSNFKDYPLCVAVLDSTLNIITIKIQEITPFTHNGIYDSTHYANKIFQGVRM